MYLLVSRLSNWYIALILPVLLYIYTVYRSPVLLSNWKNQSSKPEVQTVSKTISKLKTNNNNNNNSFSVSSMNNDKKRWKQEKEEKNKSDKWLSKQTLFTKHLSKHHKDAIQKSVSVCVCSWETEQVNITVTSIDNFGQYCSLAL